MAAHIKVAEVIPTLILLMVACMKGDLDTIVGGILANCPVDAVHLL